MQTRQPASCGSQELAIPGFVTKSAAYGEDGVGRDGGADHVLHPPRRARSTPGSVRLAWRHTMSGLPEGSTLCPSGPQPTLLPSGAPRPPRTAQKPKLMKLPPETASLTGSARTSIRQ